MALRFGSLSTSTLAFIYFAVLRAMSCAALLLLVLICNTLNVILRDFLETPQWVFCPLFFGTLDLIGVL